MCSVLAALYAGMTTTTLRLGLGGNSTLRIRRPMTRHASIWEHRVYEDVCRILARRTFIRGYRDATETRRRRISPRNAWDSGSTVSSLPSIDCERVAQVFRSHTYPRHPRPTLQRFRRTES